MKIYTRTGDAGNTSIIGGERVKKHDMRIACFGEIDELNAYIGLLASYSINDDKRRFLIEIQNLPDVSKEDISQLENEIDEMELHLAPLKNFILPGGHKEVAFCHLARTTCRKAERLIVEVSESYVILPDTLIYLNRLSDYLFVFARVMSKKLGAEEIIWKGKS